MTPAFVPLGAAVVILLFVLSTVAPIRAGSVKEAMESRWASIRDEIQERATVEFADDFHNELEAWRGSRSWKSSWSFHRAGYIRPGRLALYHPSVPLTDYRLEFLGQIERKCLAWAYRAADLENYYVSKLVVTEPGPRPLVSLVRYGVIDGKMSPKAERPVRMMMHDQTPYRVELTARGNQFSVSIEGRLVDSWSDERLESGGIGFFSDSGEQARIYWMRLACQDDVPGRLCRRLLPILPMSMVTRGTE